MLLGIVTQSILPFGTYENLKEQINATKKNHNHSKVNYVLLIYLWYFIYLENDISVNFM